MNEDPAQIEAEVMADLKKALNLLSAEVQNPTRIVVDCTGPHPTAAHRTDAHKQVPLMRESREINIRVKSVESAGTGSNGNSMLMQHRTGVKNKAKTRLPLYKLERSFNGLKEKVGIGGSLPKTEGSTLEQATGADGTKLTRSQLLRMVHRLYDKARQSDRTLILERARRKREGAETVGLTKDISKLKSAANNLGERIEELRNELRAVNADKVVLEKQLESQRANDNQAKESVRKLELELDEARMRSERSTKEHNARINELGRTHTQHCETLCKDIVKSNREIVRLRQQMTEMSNETASTPTPLPATTKLETPVDHPLSHATDKSRSIHLPGSSEGPGQRISKLMFLAAVLLLGFLAGFKTGEGFATDHIVLGNTTNKDCSTAPKVPEGLEQSEYVTSNATLQVVVDPLPREQHGDRNVAENSTNATSTGMRNATHDQVFVDPLPREQHGHRNVTENSTNATSTGMSNVTHDQVVVDPPLPREQHGDRNVTENSTNATSTGKSNLTGRTTHSWIHALLDALAASARRLATHSQVIEELKVDLGSNVWKWMKNPNSQQSQN